MQVTICTLVPPVDGIPDTAEIQNCEMQYVCPKLWSGLELTDAPNVRYCPACSKTVHFCATSDELWDAQWAGLCVAYLAERREVKRVLLGIPSGSAIKKFVKNSDE